MTVTTIVTSEGDTCSVTGVGYSSEGTIIFDAGYSELANEAVTKLLETGNIWYFNEIIAQIFLYILINCHKIF